MSEPERDGHPIVAGLVAIVGTAVAISLVLGGGAFAVSRVLGLDGDSTVARDQATSSATLYFPKPTETDETPSSYITLPDVPSDSASPTTTSSTPEPSETTSEPPASVINLTAGQTEVGSMQPIDLTGGYPGGEGAVLQVQQFSDGRWQDFPVTMSVSNEQFSTYIQTGQAGLNKIRVTDPSTGLISNVVRVTVS